MEGYQTGNLDDGFTDLIGKGCLKSGPSIPSVLAITATRYAAPNQILGEKVRMHYALAAFANDARGLAVCRAINRKAIGSDAVDTTTVPTAPSAQSGCLKYDGPAINGTFAGYIAWSRLR